ncbi:MAG: putative serine protease [Nitrospira sp.]|nr:putative serine protease [Nitrospira sp.]
MAEEQKPRSMERRGIFPARELIVVVKREAELRVTHEGIASPKGADTTPLTELLSSEGAALRPLFGVNEGRLRDEAVSQNAPTSEEVPDLAVYYKVEAPDERLDSLAERLRQLDVVEAAYVKPAAELPRLNDMLPSKEEPPLHTPDFTARQGYLDAAPGGIDARYAWMQSGGGGTGVKIVDVEGAWRFSHEDLGQNQGGIIGGTQLDDLTWRNHGTAVIGEFGGDRTGFGVTGICPDANVQAISIGDLGSAPAIRQAANRLNPGDLLLIELHRPGPRATGQGQEGFIAIEWWPDDFDAIRYATSRGIIVVEAAGNGAENLDDPIYDMPEAGFPSTWTNPFNRSNRDSGAIVVGAGAPPPGTHDRDYGPDRSRLDFSNWGAVVDAQGWGREVTTCGYGDLQGGTNEDEWYTDQFSGTSSASPIVVGALGCAQGVVRAQGKSPLTPAEARNLLLATGSPQQDAPGRPSSQRIGNRPDLRQMIARIKGKDTKDTKEKDRKELKDIPKEKDKDRKEFKDLPKEKDFKESKELKEKDKDKEGKEGKEKDHKETKDGKDKEKEYKEKDRKEFKEKDKDKDIREDLSIEPQRSASFEERLVRIEKAVNQLVHFIGPELRPDLKWGALMHEPAAPGSDPTILSQQLRKEASDTKRVKDGKDLEKLKEG